MSHLTGRGRTLSYRRDRLLEQRQGGLELLLRDRERRAEPKRVLAAAKHDEPVVEGGGFGFRGASEGVPGQGRGGDWYR